MRSSRCRPARRMWTTASGLLRGELVHLQELGESEDRVEWRPQFVAHPGQEFALGPAGQLGRLPGVAQPLLGQDPGRHVTRHDDGPGEGTRLVVDGLTARVERHPVAIGVLDPEPDLDVSAPFRPPSGRRHRPRAPTSSGWTRATRSDSVTSP